MFRVRLNRLNFSIQECPWPSSFYESCCQLSVVRPMLVFWRNTHQNTQTLNENTGSKVLFLLAKHEENMRFHCLVPLAGFQHSCWQNSRIFQGYKSKFSGQNVWCLWHPICSFQIFRHAVATSKQKNPFHPSNTNKFLIFKLFCLFIYVF